MNNVNLSRRKFLVGTAVVGGGLVMGFSLTGCSTPELPIDKTAEGFVPNAFLQITPDNNVKFYCPRDEMGQGVSTGLATLIGEELDIDPLALDVVFAGAHSDYANPDFGVQMTGGSSSIHAHWTPLRQVAANTRAMIIEAAAKDLGLSKASLTTENGQVIANGNRHPYGQFIKTAMTLEAPEETALKPANEFRYIGKTFPRVDAVAKSTGTAIYGIDVDVPGMHHAVVRRSPVQGAKLVRVDKTVAQDMPGVTDVIEISSGVAVVATKYWQAKVAAAALKPVFEDVPLSKVDTATVRRDYAEAMKGDEGTTGPDEGDVAAGFAASSNTV
ncbi:MAG: xanthine dehydrogenase family protein molybdopterin-binding subunit, partial [Pseudomonadales bacterium]|nr:xanthine dehydrogenase family protein molybdopterin-binding subunit [Pseudomonadales bacterium]